MSFWKNCFLFNNNSNIKKTSSNNSKDLLSEETPLRTLKDQNYLGAIGHIDYVPFHDEDGVLSFSFFFTTQVPRFLKFSYFLLDSAVAIEFDTPTVSKQQFHIFIRYIILISINKIVKNLFIFAMFINYFKDLHAHITIEERLLQKWKMHSQH